MALLERLTAVGAALLMAACDGASNTGETVTTCALCPDQGRPLTDARIELGRHLFYDKRLSGNGTQSCASCHQQELAFSDGKRLPLGSTGDEVPRNAPTLANVGYLPVFTWVNPLLSSLEKQAMVPLFADVVVELGATGHEEEILERLRGDPRYPEMFAAAYEGTHDDPVHFDNVVLALASFQRSLVSNRAPIDRYLAGNPDALSEAAKLGLELFNSERLECYHCHAGFNFTTAVRTTVGESWRESFVNNGLYNTPDPGGYPANNPGLYEITEKPRDIGRFRVPTLRNVTVTAPYMHDGSIATLDDVLDHYARGGRLIEDGPHAGDGALNPGKDLLIGGFELSDEERAAMHAFFESLTDEEFLRDPRYTDPFAQTP
jgi:cytochrome c peroxidase